MIAFIDEHRGAYGVEPICRVLPIAPSTFYEHVARQADPSRLPARVQHDAELQSEIRRVFEENLGVYGVRKVWRQLQREGVQVARCTVARLVRDTGLAGVVRGKPVRTTVGDKAAPCPLYRVNRQFRAPAPNMLWVSDFTDVRSSAFRAAKAPGRALSTWPSSSNREVRRTSTRSPGASSAGG